MNLGNPLRQVEPDYKLTKQEKKRLAIEDVKTKKLLREVYSILFNH